MPKYLLLKHYRGGPEPHRPYPPLDQWAPEDVEAHFAFLRNFRAQIEENGEFVDSQALTPAQTWVRYGGPGPRAPAGRSARVADRGRDAAADRRPPQRDRPAAP